jgi:triacylglycerol lipase
MTEYKSIHLVDPALLPLLEMLPKFELSNDVLAAIRANPMAIPDSGAGIGKVDIVGQLIAGPDEAPDVPIRIYRPRHSVGSTGCILHIHGGGFVLGAAEPLEPMHRALAADLNCCLVSVNYRLAPETPFPGAVEDCYAALRWVFESADELGVDRARIGVMGESAGGGLAAALGLLARDRAQFPLAFQHLIYPMLDDRTCVRKDVHPYAGEFLWTADKNLFGWTSLLGVKPGSNGISPYAAPARASDLSRLPQTFISVGTLDLFLEEDIEYARRLMRDGVPVELHVYPGAFHAFDIAPDAPVSVMARTHSRNALRRMLNSTVRTSEA